MKKRILTVLAAVSCVAALLAGCGGKEEEPKKDTAKEEETSGEEEAKGASADMIAQVEEQMNQALGELPETGKGERIGILISSTSNEFWGTMKTRYEEAAEELGIEVEVFEASAEDDTQGLTEQI